MGSRGRGRPHPRREQFLKQKVPIQREGTPDRHTSAHTLSGSDPDPRGVQTVYTGDGQEAIVRAFPELGKRDVSDSSSYRLDM